jgi:hypothetical protein
MVVAAPTALVEFPGPAGVDHKLTARWGCLVNDYEMRRGWYFALRIVALHARARGWGYHGVPNNIACSPADAPHPASALALRAARGAGGAGGDALAE